MSARKYATDEERREAERAAKRRWYERNRERVHADSIAWGKANPEKHREIGRRAARNAYRKAHGFEPEYSPYLYRPALSMEEYRTRKAQRARERRAGSPDLREKERIRSRAYYETNREAVRQRENERNAQARIAALDIYGGQCQRCGFNDKRALQFDHIQGNGHEDRKFFNRGGGTQAYWRIVAVQVQAGLYQLLCANCHAIKTAESGDWRQVKRRDRCRST